MLSTTLNIVSIIENEGISLKKRGKYFVTKCPLHAEKTPSFFVDEEHQIFCCFGCNVKGDAITFIQKYKNLDFKQACLYLKIALWSNITKTDKQKIRREYAKRHKLKNFDQWCYERKKELDDLLRTANFLRWQYLPLLDEETAWEIEEKLKNEPLYEHRWSILANGAYEQKFELYYEEKFKLFLEAQNG